MVYQLDLALEDQVFQVSEDVPSGLYSEIANLVNDPEFQQYLFDHVEAKLITHCPVQTVALQDRRDFAKDCPKVKRYVFRAGPLLQQKHRDGAIRPALKNRQDKVVAAGSRIKRGNKKALGRGQLRVAPGDACLQTLRIYPTGLLISKFGQEFASKFLLVALPLATKDVGR